MPEEKRESVRRECDNCVKDSLKVLSESFQELLGSFNYQKWLVRLLVAAILAGSTINVISVNAMYKKNAEQDVIIGTLDFTQRHIIKHLDKLVDLAEKRNRLIENQ